MAIPPSIAASLEPVVEQPMASRGFGEFPQVRDHVDATAFDLGRLRILVLVDHVLVDAGVEQAMNLRFDPCLAERGQVLARIAVEQQLVEDGLADSSGIALPGAGKRRFGSGFARSSGAMKASSLCRRGWGEESAMMDYPLGCSPLTAEELLPGKEVASSYGVKGELARERSGEME